MDIPEGCVTWQMGVPEDWCPRRWVSQWVDDPEDEGCIRWISQKDVRPGRWVSQKIAVPLDGCPD